ncbi:hypothetical protein EJB05_31711, partial [Eragrostis curvula]
MSPAILLLLLLLPLIASFLSLHDTVHADCKPATCGNLTVKYPFWLGGINNKSSSPCGHPAFQVSCTNGGTVASLKGSASALHIRSVDYDNNCFVAIHTRVADGDDGVCRTDLNISDSIVPSPFTYRRRNRALFFLYNCNGTDPLGPEYVNATSNCSAPIYAYLGGSFGRDTPSLPATGRCTFTYFPVMESEGENLTAANFARLLKDGFVLEWQTARNGDCPACVKSGGECRYGNDTAAFACLCTGSKVSQGSTCAGRNRTSTKPRIIIALTVAVGSLLLPCIYVLIWHRKGRKRRKTSSNNERNIVALISSHGSLAPKRYKYSETTKITTSFNNKLGEGGYGAVFKGMLQDGRQVAVKLLHDSKAKGEEFVNEVMSIGRTSHVNIVSLFGFCLEGSKRALIYEYMPNGSLDKYIYSENPKAILGWERLYAIAVGIARGLEYLHHSCNTRIVHFDIKPQNILLDHNFCPKIADFGLAKLCHTKESKLSLTGARGTIGFIAPEVHSRTFGVVSTKSDVYSYGMMLLEMIGGRKNVKSVVEKSSQKYFPEWIYDHFAQDDGLQACGVTREVEEIAKKMSLIGLWCIQILPMHRPTITKVLEMFERSSDELDMPPRQNFSQIFEDSAYNLSAESTISNPSKTLAYNEVVKIKDMDLANSIHER